MSTDVNKPKLDANGQPLPQQPQGPISVSGTPITAVEGGVGQPTPQGTATGRKPSGSGRFTNIQGYLQANQGAGEKIAGQIGQDVKKQTEKLGQAVGQAGAIGSQLQAERDRLANVGSLQTQLQTDPTKVNVEQFRQISTGQTALNPIQQQAQQTFDTAQGELGRVQQLAGQTGTEAGRFELLRQSLGRPGYSRGQQKLDQLLVQAGGGGNVLSQLQQQTQQQARAGEQLLGGTQADIQSQIGALGTQAKTAQETLTGALGQLDNPATPDIDESAGSLGGLQKELTTRAAQKKAELQSMYDAARKGLETGEIDRETAIALGIAQPGQTDIMLGSLTNEDLLSRLSKGFDDVTTSQAAEEHHVAESEALKKLAGLTGPTAIDLDKAQLGTAGVGAKIDAGQLQKDIEANRAGLQQQFEGTQLDPFAAQRLMAGAAKRLINQTGQVKGNKDLQRLVDTFTGAEAGVSGRANDRLGNIGGLSYGRIQGNSQDLVGNLRAYLQAYGAKPEIVDQLTKKLSGEQVKNALMHEGGFSDEISKRMSTEKEKLGLNRTLKIK